MSCENIRCGKKSDGSCDVCGKGRRPIVGLVTEADGEDRVEDWYPDGAVYHSPDRSPGDLVNVRHKAVVEVWRCGSIHYAALSSELIAALRTGGMIMTADLKPPQTNHGDFK